MAEEKIKEKKEEVKETKITHDERPPSAIAATTNSVKK